MTKHDLPRYCIAHVHFLSHFIVEEIDAKQGRVAAGIIAGIFIALAALTSALPPLGPLKIAVPAPSQTNLNNGDSAWVMTSTALVLLMTPGEKFYCFNKCQF